MSGDPSTRDPIRLGLVAESPDMPGRVSATLKNRGFVLQTVSSLDELADGDMDNLALLLIERAKLSSPQRHELRALSSGGAERRFLILSAAADEKVVRRAMSVGAAGVIRQADLEATLESAVRAILAGLACFPLDVPAPSVKPILTTREKQILGMVVLGMSNADIARRLYLAESTVKSHLSVSYAKLGVRGRNEAAAVILDPTDGFGIGILHISDPAQP
jgi:DNA-binding NarL/FixJ family response regulator